MILYSYQKPALLIYQSIAWYTIHGVYYIQYIGLHLTHVHVTSCDFVIILSNFGDLEIGERPVHQTVLTLYGWEGIYYIYKIY